MPLPLLAALLLAVPSAAAQGAPADEARYVELAIRSFVAEFERGRFDPSSVVRSVTSLSPRYVALARRIGYVGDRDFDRLQHLDVLNKLLYFAERNPSEAMADALLEVAAAGLDRSFLDRSAIELRELGHTTLLRSEHPQTWLLVVRAASGDRLPMAEPERPKHRQPKLPLLEGPARRVAALRLLGARNVPAYRSTIENALTDTDPRVRLAAVEALSPPFRPALAALLVDTLEIERHPVVAQSLVQLLLRSLRELGDRLDPDLRRDLVARAVATMGRAGWRTDMDLLDLVEAFPDVQAIPHVIEALDLELRSPDALVSAVNERASPLLRERAGALLRAMTGALLPEDDVAAWRTFWQQERDRIAVPERLAREDRDATRAEFFGVPVTGSSIAFLIDTSSSMDQAPTPGFELPGRPTPPTRLAAAKEQLLQAVQAMPKESQFRLLTFADRAHVWTPEPIRPGRRSNRDLTELLTRLQSAGGTNLYEGLVRALEIADRRFATDAAITIDELFVLSDGEPTTGAMRDARTMLDIVRTANRYAKVRIHTVFTGSGPGGELLQQLAEQNGGVFVRR